VDAGAFEDGPAPWEAFCEHELEGLFMVSIVIFPSIIGVDRVHEFHP
jgi:hypothetical protein